jgi:hypothetical protein
MHGSSFILHIKSREFTHSRISHRMTGVEEHADGRTQSHKHRELALTADGHMMTTVERDCHISREAVRGLPP